MVKMEEILQSVYASVCSAGSRQGNGLAQIELQGVLHYLLHRKGILLHLEAAVGCSLVHHLQKIPRHALAI
jgi:hypothetical protein